MRRVFCRCSPLEESVPPPGFEFPSQGPINREPFCAGVVLAVLRAYGPGAERSQIAQWSGLDQDHVEEALRHLKAQRYAERQTRRIPWYYGDQGSPLLGGDTEKGVPWAGPCPGSRSPQRNRTVSRPGSGGSSGQAQTQCFFASPNTPGMWPLACSPQRGPDGTCPQRRGR